MKLYEKPEKIIENLKRLDLPIGNYVVDPDGRFLYCCSQVRSMLGLPAEGDIEQTLADFYINSKERTPLLEAIQKDEDEEKRPTDHVLRLHLGSRLINARCYCRTIRQQETECVLGYFGCMTEITEDLRYHQLFDTLPAGIYQLDAEDKFQRVNQAVVTLLGYEKSSEILGRRVSEFYANPNEADAMRDMVMESDSVQNHKVELVKKDGEKIFAAVTCKKLITNDNYAGREGTLVDVTIEEQYRRLIAEVPVGLYFVRHVNGEDIIEDCNEAFLEMFDCDDKRQLIGKNIRILYESDEDFEQFMREIAIHDARQEALLGYALNVKSLKENKFTIEVNSRLLHLGSEITGRVGAVRNIAKEVELKRRVMEFGQDVGSVLHAYTTNLLTVRLLNDAVSEALGESTLDREKVFDMEEALQKLSGSADKTAHNLLLIIEDIETLNNNSYLEEELNEFRNNLQMLNERNEIMQTNLHLPSFLSAIAGNIQNTIDKLKGKYSRVKIRNLTSALWEMNRERSLIALHQAKSEILQFDHQVRALRDYITYGIRNEDPKKIYLLTSLVRQASYNIQDYAKERGIVFRYKFEDLFAKVEVIEREVVRAISNLIHNAVKYSWQKTKDKPPYVLIQTTVNGLNAYVEIINWGLGIPKGEINRGNVFEIGFRGRWSGDRGRTGTGIGLTDSKRVAVLHGGDIIIRSNPADPIYSADDPSNPFVTVATLRLPLTRRRK